MLSAATSDRSVLVGLPYGIGLKQGFAVEGGDLAQVTAGRLNAALFDLLAASHPTRAPAIAFVRGLWKM